MKLNNRDIWTAQESLRKLSGQKFPVMVSYKLAKLINGLNEQFKVIEEVRVSLLKQYGEPDDKGQLSVKPDGENWEKFVAEFDELMAIEHTIDIEKVRLPEKVASTCDKCHNNMDKAFEIEPSVLINLDKFIEVG